MGNSCPDQADSCLVLGRILLFRRSTAVLGRLTDGKILGFAMYIAARVLLHIVSIFGDLLVGRFLRIALTSFMMILGAGYCVPYVLLAIAIRGLEFGYLGVIFKKNK